MDHLDLHAPLNLMVILGMVRTDSSLEYLMATSVLITIYLMSLPPWLWIIMSIIEKVKLYMFAPFQVTAGLLGGVGV